MSKRPKAPPRAPARPPPRRRIAAPDAGTIAAAAAGAGAALAVAGAALMVTFVPEPASARDSVAASLDILRGAHAWGATLLVALLLALVARAWAADDARARAPRRWVPLLLTLGVALAALETGEVLPWDHQAWLAWSHTIAAVDVAPGLAATAPGVTDAPLPWLFWAHVLVPLAAVAGLAAWTRPWEGVDKKKMAAAGVAFVAVALLGALAPPAVGPQPVAGFTEGHPAWPFLWIVPLQDALGPVALLALPALGVLAAAAFALGSAWPRTRRLALLYGAAAALAALSAWGALR